MISFNERGAMSKYFLGLMTRCKDEYFVSEFVGYYLNQGVDRVYIIDDDSFDKSIYDSIINNPKVTIIFENDIINKNYASKLYSDIRDLFEWLIYLDVDEFVLTKAHSSNTIRDELVNTFSNVDCIKIPWVMMSSNKQIQSPESILTTNLWRWDHDLKHPNPIHKFRCRYDKIEVKCIFRPDKFADIKDHHPIEPIDTVSIVESVSNAASELNPFYDSLREKDIKSAFLVCYHYRIISVENNAQKLKNNLWYIKKKYTLDDLNSSDYAEVFDDSMLKK